jgi:hypothetical protein
MSVIGSLCEEEPYFLELAPYIHLNPAPAGIATDMAGLNSYPWSGSRVILGKGTSPWMDRDFTLPMFGATKRKAQAAYRCFISAGFSMGHQPRLAGGGLVHSLGGWSKAASLRQHGAPEKGDESILGSSEFVMTALRKTEEKQRRQVKAASADAMLHLT